MAYPFVIILIKLYRERTKVFDNFRILIRPIRKAIKENDFYSDKLQKIIFEKRPFRRSYGFLPAVERLEKLNQNILEYNDEAGNIEANIIIHVPEANKPAAVNSFKRFQELLAEEQHYLKTLLGPALEQIHERQNYKESWKGALKDFENFVLLFNAELKRFEVFLNELKKAGLLAPSVETEKSSRKSVISLVVIRLKENNFEAASAILNSKDAKVWLQKEEVQFLQKIVFAIGKRDPLMLEYIIYQEKPDGTKVFRRMFTFAFEEEEQRRFFVSFLEGLKGARASSEPPRQRPIQRPNIRVEYHLLPSRNYFSISVEDDNRVHEEYQLSVHAGIIGSDILLPILSERIERHNYLPILLSRIIQNGRYGSYNITSIANPIVDDQIDKSEEYDASMSLDIPAPLEGGSGQNEGDGEVGQLASRLDECSTSLEQLASAAGELGAPQPIVQLATDEIGRIRETAAQLQEEETPNDSNKKRFRKSLLRRLKARVRLARMKRKKSRKEAITQGREVLIESAGVRKKLIEFIRKKIMEILSSVRSLEQRIRAMNLRYSLDLKPIRRRGKKVWVVTQDSTAREIDAAIKQIGEIRERIITDTILWAETNLQKDTAVENGTAQWDEMSLRKEVVEVPSKDIILKSRKLRKAYGILLGLFKKINLKRATAKFMITALTVPILVGAFPSKVSSSYVKWETKNEAIHRVLRNYIPYEKIDKMLEPSAFVDQLMKVMEERNMKNMNEEDLPDYLRELLSDGILDIGMFVGAQFESETPIEKDEVRLTKMANKLIMIRFRYIANIRDAMKAFEECDVISVDSHSRYGLGWALAEEGMANPLKMQTHPVKILKADLYGYKGKILKDLNNGYVIVQSSDEDLVKMKPRKGYQLITMGSCNSKQHFLEIMKRLREGLPTTVIYTTDEPYITRESISKFLEGLLTGEKVEQLVEHYNEVYKKVSRWKGELPVANLFEAVVLNVDANSPESRQYDKHNIPNAITLFYDVVEK